MSKTCGFLMLIVAVVLVMAVTTRALPIMPEPIPVARLVANLTERVSKSPGDVQAVFTLGRVHYFAFSGATDTVHVTNSAVGQKPYDFMGPPGKATYARGKSTRPLTADERVSHLKNALTYLQRAAAMTKSGEVPDDGRYALSLACALEEGAPFAETVGPMEGLAPDGKSWTEAAIRHYGEAFDKAAEKDRALTQRPIFGLSTLVSDEAGRSYRRLVYSRGTWSAEERSRIDRIDAHLEKLGALPMGPVTPLIFAVNRTASLADLLSTRTVPFNLNGSNLPQRWRWVRPDTAILVWDPVGTGRISSGRQLFGSVTWWMFWDDAYQALAALDDDRNGWIEGRELAGLALWFDRNQNGRSEAGEVVPVAESAVTGIAATARSRIGGVAMNAAGVRLRDGRVLPTYDWIATPR